VHHDDTCAGRSALPEFAPLVSISDPQRIPLPDLNWVSTIYYGLPEKLLSPRFDQLPGYLEFLGRIAPEKGPDVAIRIARKAGLPLRVAKIPRSESRYFKEKIKPLLAGNRIEFLRSYEVLSSRRENLSIPPSITPDQGRVVSNQVVDF
jgi:glycosyltransferase involved in cell wall biosynthesis